MKKYLIFLTFVLALSIGGLAACSGGGTVRFTEDEIVLGRYEERQIEVEYDGSGELSWSSSDESVVTVTDGYAVAQGTGTATVTVSAGKSTDTVSVRVRDDGTRPFIDGEDLTLMEGQTVDGGFSVIYLEQEAPNAELTFEVADPAVASVSADGRVTGLTIGTTTITVNCTYKGLELTEKEYTVTVTESTFMDIENEFNIFLIDSEYVEKSVTIAPEIYVDAALVEDPEIEITVLSGGEYITVSGNTITAKAVGKAEINVSYAPASLEKEIAINVFDNYIEDNEDFYYAGVWGSTYEPYDGEDELFAGSYVYTTGARNGGSQWDWHLSSRRTETEGDVNFKSQEIIDAGYKYFSYKLYYTGSTQVYLGLGDSAFWIAPGRSLARDWIYLLNGNEVTNRMEANTWITVVINLGRIVEATKRCDLFVLTEGANEVTYVKDVRYYYNDEGLFPEGWEEPEPNVVTYEQKDGYVQASLNDFILAETTEYYMPFEGTIDGVENPYLYRNKNTSWWDGRICLSSTHYDTYGAGAYDNLKKNTYDSDWVAFDMWYSGTAGIHVGISGGIGPMKASVDGGLSMETATSSIEDKYVYILEDGAVTDKFVANRWITIAIHFEAVADSGWASEFYLGLDDTVSAFAFISNIRYYTDERFDLAGKATAEADNTLAAYAQAENDDLFAETVADATMPSYAPYSGLVGEMRGVSRLETLTDDAWVNKLQFKTLHAAGHSDDWAAMAAAVHTAGYTYATVNLYLTDETPLVVYVPDASETNNSRAVTLEIGTEYTGGDIFIVDLEGKLTNTLQTGEWLMLAVSLEGIEENSISRTGISFAGQTEAYFTNIRYYTCDAYKVGNITLNAVGQDEELDPYTQMEMTELQPGSQSVTFALYGEAVAGVEGVYLYEATVPSAWNNRLDFMSTTPYSWGGGDDDWMTNNQLMMQRGWQYVTFNAYIPAAAEIMFFIPISSGNPETVVVPTGTPIADERIIAIDSEGNNAGQLLVGEWMTIAFRVDGAAGESVSAWGRASISYNDKTVGSMYITNIRYYTNNDFMSGTLDGAGGETEPPAEPEYTLEVMQSYGNNELVSMDATGSSYAPYDGEIGGVSGAYLYEAKAGEGLWPYQRRLEFYHTTPGAWELSGDNAHLDYNSQLYERGWNYVMFDIYIDPSSEVGLVLRYPPVSGDTVELTIVPGAAVTSDLVVLMKNGEKTDILQRGEWYTVAFRIDATAAAPGTQVWTWAECSIALSGAGTAYINNIRYAKAVPVTAE